MLVHKSACWVLKWEVIDPNLIHREGVVVDAYGDLRGPVAHGGLLLLFFTGIVAAQLQLQVVSV